MPARLLAYASLPGRRWLQRQSFRRQLSIGVTLGTMLLALATSLACTWQASRQIETSLLGQGLRVTEAMASQSNLALVYGSADNALAAVKTTLSFPDVTQVTLRLPDGKVLLSQGQAADANDARPPSPQLRQPVLSHETARAWHFVAPVLSQPTALELEGETPPQQLLGFVQVVQSKDTLRRMVVDVFTINLAISFLFAFVFVLGIRYLSRRLTRPLTDLARVMAEAERGQRGVQARLSGSSEIAGMAKAFNRMMAALDEREQALEESRRHYREVIETVKEVIFQSDALGRWQFLNPAWTDITGFAVEASLGQPISDYLHGEDLAVFSDCLQQLESHQTGATQCELRLRRADGRLVWLEVRQRSLFSEYGEYLGTSGILNDISERKRAEAELAEHQAHLEDLIESRTEALANANRDLEAFSYSVSHDLRAPLRRINGFSHLLEEDYANQFDETARMYLSRIRSGIASMDELIEALLSLGRITRAHLDRAEVDLSVIVRTIIEEFQHAEPERDAVFRISPTTPVYADPALMRVVLQNLLGNAWKYSAKKPQTRIEFGTALCQGRHAHYVRDNGAGFDMAYAAQLFGVFQRLHQHSDFEGTGIGLATVQRVIHRHGGEIWAEAVPGEGATFFFTLGGQHEP
ncbi:sensor histidine kinase [Chitinimonas lacunae]|uniref:histidine kinase n=1 Tax=Chitinimonas lacunae TaxID=1963018 RepID=A0ABV8MMY3_9NEIS